MLLTSRALYPQLLVELNKLDEADKTHAVKELCKTDLFYLLVYAMGRLDANKDWLFDRCREVQAEPNGMLDLWSREHYKSTVITFALTIQEILNNPNVTIGIFSHTRPIAKGFLRQIKRELELNVTLKALFPEILYENPSKEAIKWSEDDGIIVKRSTNPKEATIEAWGVVDGQPTGKHFNLLIYDDVVTKESVNTPEMIEKTTDALALSYNLGAHGGRRRFIGTRYHFSDTYKVIMDRGTATPRIHAATHDGSMTGTPVFLTQEQLDEKRRDQGPYVFSCFVGGTSVTKSDWNTASIESLCVGDKVVGYSFPQGKGNKTKLIETTVIAISNRVENVSRFTFESGRSVICTEDHKFYTGRRGIEIGGTDHRKSYAKLGLDKMSLKAAISVIDMLYMQGTRDFGRNKRDNLVKIEKLGEQTVYNIQTESGNYIANGYATKNCQMLQNPVADGSQGFKREWKRTFESQTLSGCNWYLLVDAANGKRKSNDYTSIWAVGLGSDEKYYCIPEVRDRINLTERANRIIDLHRKYKPIQVRYEKYGMMADVEYIMAVQEKKQYRFDIYEVSGSTSKTDRIKRLVPLFETGKIYLPESYYVTDYEGKSRDLIHDFIEEEFIPFPVPLHDDMLDALSRICEIEGTRHGEDTKSILTLEWPTDTFIVDMQSAELPRNRGNSLYR
jgi:predicted phage terminase large subunit-like protein